MSQNNGKITITIDNKPFEIEKGLTILQAAEQNNIYIPTLCAHKDLTPYGGCRMCIVEVEGARGFLTSCTTPVEDGMIVRTHTDQIQKERKEILELILSEHTSSCLICDEREECKKSMSTIRKVGVTTGCRYCPNDDKCELEEIVRYLGINEISHPVYYRNLPVEKEDPFYDRDYNLCILCGRCVRMCQEVRLANVLAFNQRGRNTVIGPAFGRTHIEAGCEFCGACVSVCPTGALSEKSNKWDGLHEREEITTCALCGVGCQMRVLIKGNRAIGTLPAEDHLVNNGQLCVKGRFCVNELVNHYQRLERPIKVHNGSTLKINWETAIDIVTEKLSNCAPNDFGMIVSSNCTNEDMYIAQKFSRIVMDSHNIDASARLFYGAGFNAYLNLMKKSVPLSEISKSDTILCIGLDIRYGKSVVGVQLRKAIARGAKIITINPKDHSLTLSAYGWVRPDPGEEVEVLQILVELTGKGKIKNNDKELVKIAELLKNASTAIILIGSDFIHYNTSPDIFENIEKLARNIGAGVLPLPAQNNLYGSLMMGVYPELLPGGFSTEDKAKVDEIKKLWKQEIPYFNSNWNAEHMLTGDKLKIGYLIGEFPLHSKAIADFLIYQNIYAIKDTFMANITLPAAAFTETDGTFINGEGRIQRVRKAVDPPGSALPDWKILCWIAQKMGKKGFDFSNVADIQREIRSIINGFENIERKVQPLLKHIKLMSNSDKKPVVTKIDREFPFLLTISHADYTYRGVPLTSKVEGLTKIITEEAVMMNPEDAHKAGIFHGDEVVVTSHQFKEIWPICISSNQKPGTLHITLHRLQPINPNPHYVKIGRKDV